jgi:hypothetical protein
MMSETMIMACDERGPGHANHLYRIINTRPSAKGDGILQEIKFQKGPIQENGVNGVQNEDLLSIVIDRLVGFQTSGFECEENERALDCCIEACAALQLRTAKRKARGVEGKSEK